MFISLIGTWIQMTAQSWLVFHLTDSVFLLGVVGFLSVIPVFLLSLFGGVAADRVNKKVILLLTQSAFMLLAFILAVLVQTERISTYQIMCIAVLDGIVMAFDAPSRQAVVAELVDRGQLPNAIALNSAAFNSSRILGPMFAALLISGIGMSGCFYLNGVSFLAVIFALLLIKVKEAPGQVKRRVFWHDLVEGLRFVRANRLILILVAMVGVTSLFGISYTILMPVFAEDVLHVGVRGLGSLMSAAGVGALTAALILARLGDFRRKGRMLLASSLVFSFSLMVFAFSKIFALSLAALVMIGWASVTAVSLINTLLQHHVPDEFRGRLMSIFMCTFAGFMPFGNLIAGSLSAAWGVSVTVFFSGAVCAVFFIVINAAWPDIREL